MLEFKRLMYIMQAVNLVLIAVYCSFHVTIHIFSATELLAVVFYRDDITSRYAIKCKEQKFKKVCSL